MSYILEALKKSERERQLGQAPSLPVLIDDHTPPRRRWLPWTIAGLLLALNIAVLAYFGLRQSHETTAPAPVAAAVPSDHGQSAKPRTVRRTEVPQVVPAIAEPRERSTDRARKPAEQSAADANPPAVSRETKHPETPRKEAEELPLPPKVTASQAVSPPDRTQDAPVQAKSRDADRAKTQESRMPALAQQDRSPAKQREPARELPQAPAVPAEPPQTAEKSAENEDIPLLSTMPTGFQQRTQPLALNVLAYTPKPEGRFAVINMAKYFKGDQLPNGAVLTEIRSDSVVLELDGQRFRITQR